MEIPGSLALLTSLIFKNFLQMRNKNGGNHSKMAKLSSIVKRNIQLAYASIIHSQSHTDKENSNEDVMSNGNEV